MLLIFSSGQGAAVAGLDLRAAIENLYPALNASGAADLVFWTEAELYAWADEAAKRLARVQGGFVDWDDSITVAEGVATYNLAAGHLSTIHASLDGTALRPATVQELEARDEAWVETASATIKRWLPDVEGTGKLRLWPKPGIGAGVDLLLIAHRYPAEIVVGSAVVDAPVCLQDYWQFAVLGEARAKESKGAMPEAAEWCGQMATLYERVCREYWGGAQ